jgi:glucose-1-phosphate cytidylyltransferase
MKTAILAGGRGSRMLDAFGPVPKPLVPVGDRPVLRHVLDCHAAQGFSDFVIALGYRGDRIREYFGELSASVTTGDLKIELVETGADTDTGGRVLRLRPRLADGRFLLAWADGLSDVDLNALVAFHVGHGRVATVVAVHPPPRFGQLSLDGARVLSFEEKPQREDEWINGGICVLEPKVFDFIGDDACSWERDVMPALARAGELMAWRHESFWQCMDTPEEQRLLEALWCEGRAPWVRGWGR